jgi:hypothetical protein
MTMRVSIKDQYVEKFEDFISTLPSEAVQVDTIDDNSISFEQAQLKVQKAINNISSNQGLDLDTAFEKVANC